MVDRELQRYIERHILPLYDNFDGAHRRDHAEVVIRQSMALAEHYDLNKDMVYAIAAYHDTGLQHGRERHHIHSAEIVRHDAELRRWFNAEQIEIMAEAVEDHRASSKAAPRTIYGRIVAEADRLIDSRSIVRRTIQFTLTNHPELGRDEGYTRLLEHMYQKYDYGGYLTLWIEESENGRRLEQLRQLIADGPSLRKLYDELYDELTTPSN